MHALQEKELAPTTANEADSITVFNPATGERLYDFTPTTSAECRTVMTQARAAVPALRETTMAQRLEALDALLAYLERKQEWLLDRIVAESGRSRGDAMLSDIFQLTEDCLWLRHHAEKALADDNVPTPITLMGKQCRILYQPRGVVVVVSPWNLPLAIGMTAAMFAFMAGNAVVLKPSEHTPMVQALEEIRHLHPLLEQAFQVVHGKGQVAVDLIAERPDLICFTGSVPTGKKILAQAAPLVIPVIMELGAKDAMIVFNDADLARAVAAACWGNLHNSGQSCTATERIFVQEGVYDDFVKRLVAASQKIRLGTGADADLGAITTDFQLRHIESLVEDARSKGARILCGGQRSECGRFYLPTIITHTTEAMRIGHEEIFGPVLTVEAFSREEEVITRHNAMPLGLSSSVWTEDNTCAERLTRALETGCININNVMLTEGNASLPFGGVKYSGFGRMKGVEGLRGMTRSKAVMSDSTRGKPEPNWYPYSATKLSLMQQLLAILGQRNPLRYLKLAKVGLAIDSLAKKAPKA
jgi:acyl-CoA reductase-like NAD-dependent aldehyde dehydrogenase